MDASEPRVRRRGFFLHSTDGANPRPESTKTRKGSPFASVSAAAPFLDRFQRRPFPHTSPDRRRATRNQIRERDWQPSTGTLAPLIQLARGDTRNATTAPTSSGRPKRPNGSSRLTKSAIPAGSSC